MPSNKPTPYAVHCLGIDPTCGAGPCTEGLVFLTLQEYKYQMSHPSNTWRCPRCNGDAEWDDDNYEKWADNKV